MTAIETLKSLTAKKDTDTLLGALLILEAQDNLADAERLVQAVTTDVLMERYGLEDALDALLFDDEFEGTCTDALLIAMAQAGVNA